MKKKYLYIILLLIFAYSGLYIYKMVHYAYYDRSNMFGGGEDTYIFNKYHEQNDKFPSTAVELRKFIVDNDTLFVANLKAEYLVNYDFHIMYDEESDLFLVYENGPNYRDDELEIEANSSNTNFFNFLVANGDVLMFTAKNSYSKTVPLDANIELPPNVTIILDSED